MDEFLRIGVVTTTHGVHGEVKVYPTTDDLERFKQVRRVFLEKPDGSRTETRIENVKYFKNMAILKLALSNTMDEAETLRNADILILRQDAPALSEGEYYIYDLIGLEAVRENGESLGTLTEILTTSGANDVYNIRKPDGKEILLPAIPDCIKEIDLQGGKITVNVLPGLED